jgi:hypothetical protein
VREEVALEARSSGVGAGAGTERAGGGGAGGRELRCESRVDVGRAGGGSRVNKGREEELVT